MSLTSYDPDSGSLLTDYLGWCSRRQEQTGRQLQAAVVEREAEYPLIEQDLQSPACPSGPVVARRVRAWCGK